MSNPITLRSLFDSRKSELEQKLQGMFLPKDNLLVQSTISEYLSTLFDSDGEFRQGLTLAEDYLLQATLSLLNAQQEMGSSFLKQEIRVHSVDDMPEKDTASNPEKPFMELVKDLNIPAGQAALGSGVGALAGRIALGSWGAVFGAIAGTAVVVYLASKKPAKPTGKRTASHAKVVQEPIDTESFISVVGRVCDSVDNLIATFRAQVARVADKYESMEKPSIEKEYKFLLESIQTLIGYERTHSTEEEKYSKKIQSRIEDLAECLENYNLETVDYDGSNDSYFDMVTSPETPQTHMVYPAIVKDGVAVLKGKVFIPQGV